ncbi:LLM class F420-dependent oxidoreductase, partial [Amycolatopsis sp. NPDC049252]
TSLLGPEERIAEKMTQFAEAGVTTLSVSPFGPDPAAALTTAVEALERAGVA